jgi:NADPH-dependent glutamate synthase beta subunit-like oxidoreductase/Pyruvate/2-oxoacid:ferredoxin oxidoreductase delta subunit
VDGLPFRTLAQQLEKLPPCQAQCPNSGDVRGWLGIIAQHEKIGLPIEEAFDRAWERLAERNPLPAVIGRICPHPCEDLCTRSDKDGAVSINAMERFLGDWALERKLCLPPGTAERREESIGVVGSGPASLSFAYQMARHGYGVTVYEKHAVPGGMLRHAIPDYRLPREVLDAEVRRVFQLDIELVTGVELGSNLTLDELRERHELVFLGLGAQAGRALGIPGEEGPGVIPGIDYLAARKQGEKPALGKRVLVIGGGNTAMDAARSARRDAAAVTVLYRRSEAEMPAAAQEIADARDEGVTFRFLVAPTCIIRDGNAVKGVEAQVMRLGEPDSSGRRRPVPVAGLTETLAADTVIVAVSQAPDWHDTPGLEEQDQWLHTRDDGQLEEDLWAGGDDRGPGIASRAIAQGRLAAESANARLRGEPVPGAESRRPVQYGSVKADFYAGSRAAPLPRRPPEEWLSSPELEIDRTISRDRALAEAARCMSCGLCFDCRQCFMYCNASGFTRIEEPRPGNYFVFAMNACEGCGKCIEICPCGYLESRDEG